MKQKARVVVLAFVWMGCAAVASASNAPPWPRYSVTNLPALGGTTSQGSSINTFGLIAGFSNLSGDQVTHAAAWWFGRKFDLGTLGGANSAVEWPVKNDFGVISGISETDKPQLPGESWSCTAFLASDGHTCLGFVWTFGKLHALQPLPGGYNSFATGTNDRFQTVGWAENGVHDPQCNSDPDKGFVQILQFLPVVWRPGPDRIHALALLPGDDSGAATAINDRGEIVGISGTCDQAVGRHTAKHMVLWKNEYSQPINLGDIGGDAWNTPMAINRQGDVVGFGNTLPGLGISFHAFFRSHTGGPPVDIGALYPEDISEALGINGRGQVVGLSCGHFPVCHGVLWQDGKIIDLNDLVPGYSSVIEDAQDINDLGQITGQSLDAAGHLVTFLATPVPDYGDHPAGHPSKRAVLSGKQKPTSAPRLGLGGIGLQQAWRH